MSNKFYSTVTIKNINYIKNLLSFMTHYLFKKKKIKLNDNNKYIKNVQAELKKWNILLKYN